MPRREHLLVPEEGLFVQAFARADAGIADLDVASNLEPGEPHQIGSEVDDPDRLTHVEHEDLSTAAQRTRLEHQLDRFGDGHEVATHLRMRDRERPAGADLFQEGRYDGAAAT